MQKYFSVRFLRWCLLAHHPHFTGIQYNRAIINVISNTCAFPTMTSQKSAVVEKACITRAVQRFRELKAALAQTQIYLLEAKYS